MKLNFLLLLIGLNFVALGQYAPSAGQIGTTAIQKDSSIIISWGTNFQNFKPGKQDIQINNSPKANFGAPSNALGYAEGNSMDVISLGDGGEITIGFKYPIKNGQGPDFAVFENSVWYDFLELAFVEVSTNGIDFVRFPSISLTQNQQQINTFGLLDPTKIYNLAGKYKQGFGTPFELEELIDSTQLNLDSINFIRIIDVVGSIDKAFATYDSKNNLINDPYPTPFESCGFDLDAIGIINENNIYASFSKKNNPEFVIYPNPAVDYIHIKTKQTETEICVYSIYGQYITNYYNTNKINVSNWDNGTYLFSIKINNEISIEKVSISH